MQQGKGGLEYCSGDTSVKRPLERTKIREGNVKRELER